MTIEIKSLLEIVIIVLTLKLIVGRWKPPVQESLQAIICIALGTILGIVINPTVEGFVAGVISSGIAFYGGDLLSEFRSIKSEIVETDNKFPKNKIENVSGNEKK